MRADSETLQAIAAAYGYLSTDKLRRPVSEFLSDVDQQRHDLCRKCASKDPRCVLSWPAFRNQKPRRNGTGAQPQASTRAPAAVGRATAGIRKRKQRKPANSSHEAKSDNVNEELSVRETVEKRSGLDVSSNPPHVEIAIQVFFVTLQNIYSEHAGTIWAEPPTKTSSF